ncbi:MAG: aldo/keto reductase [Hyphomicrobiaceae bacterium]
MKFRPLGNSGVRVSELCLGTMMFGGETPEAEAQRIIDHARGLGVNFVDTANSYNKGASEEVLGRAIKATRQHWVLATKVCNPMGPGKNDRGLSRLHLMREVDASLRRLDSDVIDILYVHREDPLTPWPEVARSFADLIRAGKIRYWGLSNLRAWQIVEICHICRTNGFPEPVVLQPYYNLMNRQPEVEVLPAARHLGLGVVPYSPIARGVLTGKYRVNTTPEPGSRAARKDRRMMQAEWRDESLLLAETLKAHAEARGISLVAWAVAWVLNNGAISATIAGPRTFAQWEAYPAALAYTWTAEDEALANRLVTPGHPSTPGHTDPAYPVTGRFPRVG